MTTTTLTTLSTTAVSLTDTNYYVGQTGELIVDGAASVTSIGDASFVILGAVSTFGADALSLVGGVLSVNTGPASYIMSDMDDAFHMSAEYMTFSNAGTIYAGDDAIDFTGLLSGSLSFINSGQITALDGGFNIDGTATFLDIINSGTISTHGPAIDLSGVQLDTSSVIANSGQLIGSDGVAIFGSDYTDFLENSGEIHGDIYMGDSADHVTNSGSIMGAVFLEGGDDEFHSLSGSIEWFVSGGAGEDILIGGINADYFTGNTGGDLLKGYEGEDVLVGGSGYDVLVGGTGNDRLFGGNGKDFLGGGKGDDRLDGGDGRDVLRGGKGEDILTGGAGKNKLIGGEGADTFKYFANDEITVGYDSEDVIRDFETGSDVINLAALSVDEVLFNGVAALSGGGVASLNYVVVSADDIDVYIDGDGDGVAEIRITMQDLAAITADDFIL